MRCLGAIRLLWLAGCFLVTPATLLRAATFGDMTPGNPTLCFGGSATCPDATSPFEVEYTVASEPGGGFRYVFELTVTVGGGQYDTVAFGDIPSQYALPTGHPDKGFGALLGWAFDRTTDTNQPIVPPPFARRGTFGGGHNGPYMGTPIIDQPPILTSVKWQPQAGKTLAWTGVASVLVPQGDMFFSVTDFFDGQSAPWEVNFIPATLVPLPSALLMFAGALGVLVLRSSRLPS